MDQRNYFCLDAVPVQTKRLVVDKYMEVDRFREELVLLKKEMLRYMKFYTNYKLTALRQQLLDLDASIKQYKGNST